MELLVIFINKISKLCIKCYFMKIKNIKMEVTK